MKQMIALLLLLAPAGDATLPGWRIGLAPVEQPWTYVDAGGRAEYVPLQIHLSADSSMPELSKAESFRFDVRIRSAKLPEYRYPERLQRTGFSSHDRASQWTFHYYLRRLRELELFWGRLPATVTVAVVLHDDGVPAVSSPPIPVELKDIPHKDATWTQLVHTLSVGQSREEVYGLLGPALSERAFLRGSQLVYPNPDAPKEFPPESRVTHIYLDAQGRFKVANLNGGC